MRTVEGVRHLQTTGPAPQTGELLHQRRDRRLITTTTVCAGPFSPPMDTRPPAPASTSTTSASGASTDTITPPGSQPCISRPRAATNRAAPPDSAHPPHAPQPAHPPNAPPPPPAPPRTTATTGTTPPRTQTTQAAQTPSDEPTRSIAVRTAKTTPVNGIRDAAPEHHAPRRSLPEHRDPTDTAHAPYRSTASPAREQQHQLPPGRRHTFDHTRMRHTPSHRPSPSTNPATGRPRHSARCSKCVR